MSNKMKNRIKINDLPPEILSIIFQNLKNAKDRISAELVCSLWRSVICNTIGVPMLIGNGSKFWNRGIPLPLSIFIPWKKLDAIAEIGISDCVFSNVIRRPDSISSVSDNSNPNLSQPVSFLLPNLLKNLQFDGFIPQNIYQGICSHLRNLSTLVFHVSTLTFLHVQMSKENWNLCQSLKTLVLASNGFEKEYFHHYDMQRLFKNVISICGSHFPRLKKFVSTLPIFLDKEIQVYEELVTFLDRHHTTMEELELRWIHKWRVETRTSSSRSQQELDEINDALIEVEPKLDALGLRDPKYWILKSVVFIIEDFDVIIPTSLGLQWAILSQTGLERVFYMCWNFIRMPVRMIRNNATTLKEIGLTINDVVEPIDCTVFTQCSNLSKLVLQTDGQITFNDVTNDAPRVQNVSGLPTSIKCLHFRNIYMESDSVEWISKRLPQLSTLILINIGRMDNLGMTLPCLLWILKKSPRIKMLKVKGINNCCHLATFGFPKYPNIHPKCPVCNCEHYKSDENDGEGVISGEDRNFLDEYFQKTDHNTKFIPLLKNIDGIWSPTDDKI